MEKFYRTELIDEYKTKHNLSTTAFCKLCKISPSTIRRIYNHDKNLPLRFALKVISVINVALSEFIILK